MKFTGLVLPMCLAQPIVAFVGVPTARGNTGSLQMLYRSMSSGRSISTAHSQKNEELDLGADETSFGPEPEDLTEAYHGDLGSDGEGLNFRPPLTAPPPLSMTEEERAGVTAGPEAEVDQFDPISSGDVALVPHEQGKSKSVKYSDLPPAALVIMALLLGMAIIGVHEGTWGTFLATDEMLHSVSFHGGVLDQMLEAARHIPDAFHVTPHDVIHAVGL